MPLRTVVRQASEKRRRNVGHCGLASFRSTFDSVSQSHCADLRVSAAVPGLDHMLINARLQRHTESLSRRFPECASNRTRT